MTIYKIILSKRKDETVFENFMQNEVFTAVSKVQGRAGKIISLQLLKGSNTGRTNEYLWLVEGGVNGGTANRVLDKIKVFGTRIVPMNDYVESCNWKA